MHRKEDASVGRCTLLQKEANTLEWSVARRKFARATGDGTREMKMEKDGARERNVSQSRCEDNPMERCEFKEVGMCKRR